VIGQTRDDAAGEALDKVGKILGLDYPAGPELDRLGFEGDPTAVKFPRARFKEAGYEFSFSGLKTAAALDWQARRDGTKPEIARADWIASFEYAVVGALSDTLFRAAVDLKIGTVAVAGGVACNRRLRKTVTDWAAQTGRRAVIPPPRLCADNAAMIAAVGAYRLPKLGDDISAIDAIPNWPLGKPYPIGGSR
jgi:N6-L-threonylcarbamoyladenine synthase